MGGHVLNKYSCVESPGLKTGGKFTLKGGQFALCLALNEPPAVFIEADKQLFTLFKRNQTKSIDRFHVMSSGL